VGGRISFRKDRNITMTRLKIGFSLASPEIVGVTE
jgi:hypothetical protein